MSSRHIFRKRSPRDVVASRFEQSFEIDAAEIMIIVGIFQINQSCLFFWWHSSFSNFLTGNDWNRRIYFLVELCPSRRIRVEKWWFGRHLTVLLLFVQTFCQSNQEFRRIIHSFRLIGLCWENLTDVLSMCVSETDNEETINAYESEGLFVDVIIEWRVGQTFTRNKKFCV